MTSPAILIQSFILLFKVRAKLFCASVYKFLKPPYRFNKN